MKEKKIKKQLKISGLKITPARLAVIGTFSNKCLPLGAENIYEKLKKNEIDLATVYRTLISFEKAGILRRVDLHKNAQFYELNEDHHHHIICNNCGLVEELGGCNIEKFISKISSKSENFKVIKDHSLEFFGLCKNCEK